jgi:hypothetical protein
VFAVLERQLARQLQWGAELKLSAYIRKATDAAGHTLQIGGGFEFAMPADPFAENQGVVALGLVPHSCRGGTGYQTKGSRPRNGRPATFLNEVNLAGSFHAE